MPTHSVKFSIGGKVVNSTNEGEEIPLPRDRDIIEWQAVGTSIVFYAVRGEHRFRVRVPEGTTFLVTESGQNRSFIATYVTKRVEGGLQGCFKLGDKPHTFHPLCRIKQLQYTFVCSTGAVSFQRNLVDWVA